MLNALLEAVVLYIESKILIFKKKNPNKPHKVIAIKLVTHDFSRRVAVVGAWNRLGRQGWVKVESTGRLDGRMRW